jgi:hypothetical protein
MEKPAILDPMVSGNVEGLLPMLFGSRAHWANSQSGDQVTTLHF